MGCRTGPPQTGFFLPNALTSLSAVSSPWRRDVKTVGFEEADLTALEQHASFEETVLLARRAESARREADSSCIGLYTQVALNCWPALTSDDEGSDDVSDAVWRVYHHAVAQVIQQANVHDQIDPATGISLSSADRELHGIPISHHGFPWQKKDFGMLRHVKKTNREVLKRYWADQGLGVPLIAICRQPANEKYMSKDVPFSATCILRPASAADHRDLPAATKSGVVLELHDPLRVERIVDGDRQWNLARDLSAPLVMASRDIDRDNLSNFINPARSDERGGLRMLEPYQPGKIPIVVVHGLLSDKFTWADLVNDLRWVEDLNDHYQIWAFQYPTGQPFIRSAAEMRRDLSQIVTSLDPQGKDPALSEMVLVGHSMGGLVSKLLITSSDTSMWDSVASRSMDEIQASTEIRREIEQLFFFEPLPFVKRVVFIGSPHRGADMAKGFLGRLGSALVMTPNDRESRFKEFVRANPDVFTGDLATRLPSSIDLLRPDDPVLMAAYHLKVNPDVRLHTIIGTGRELSDGTSADGVVAVQSARHPGTVSELKIETTHTQLTSHPETTAEIVRILGDHLNESDRAGSRLATRPAVSDAPSAEH